MIDPHIIKLLQSGDIEKRKKAVMALAQTKDSEALPYLAQVYQSDKSGEVRQLAYKGGIYIKRQIEQAVTVVEEESYDDDDYNRPFYDAPLLSEIKVSAGDEKRAAGYIDQAMDWNIRGDNEKSAELINRALQINPHLMDDSYTVSLASTVTGLDGQAAIDLLKPTDEELKKRAKSNRAADNPIQQVFGFITSLAGLIALVSFLLFPWLDVSSMPTVLNTEGQIGTLDDIVDMLKDEINVEGLENMPPEFQDFINAIRALTLEVNGINTVLVAIGQKNTLDVTGFTRYLEVLSSPMFSGLLGEELGDVDMIFKEMESLTPDPLNYSLVMVPIAALLAMIMGLIFLRRPSVSGWLMMIVLGVMGVAPMLYFYAEGVNTVLNPDVDISLEQYDLSSLVIPDMTTFLGYGFWVSLGAMLAVFLLPFVAMLIMPSAPKEGTA